MNIKLILNEYILIWNLLFKESISKELNDKKQKIWFNYKKAYNDLYQEKEGLIHDPENYIPNDDTIYNIMKEGTVYNKIYHYTEQYKLTLLKNWDTLKKELKSIIKIELQPCQVYIIDPRLNSVEYLDNSLIYGVKKMNSRDEILNLMYHIVQKNIKNYHHNNQEVRDAVIELCILDELATRISGRSHYLEGNPVLNLTKRKIYPYFLMYLGKKRGEFPNMMNRDGIVFDVKYYKYDKRLKKMDINEFIDFCTKLEQKKEKQEELELI